MAYARLKAALSRYRLPPGKIVPLDELERSDRYFLLHQATQVGPIFKAKAWKQFWVCVIGLPLCRRFLQEHGDHLVAETLKLDSLFPRGFMRRMEGEDHRKYRKALDNAISNQELLKDEGDLCAIAERELSQYYTNQEGGAEGAKSYRSTLNRITTIMLIHLFYGVRMDSPTLQKFLEGYSRLGRFGLVWDVGQEQNEAFNEIKNLLRLWVAQEKIKPSPSFSRSILGRSALNGTLDETMIGNLIYMVEMGRYDMAGLLRWLSKYAAEEPATVHRMRSESPSDCTGSSNSLAEAFVLETLRTDQSERLVRVAQEDLIFDGFLIPKHTRLRLCLWESHKSENSFQNPFKFDAGNFTKKSPSIDEYSPFGLDHHRCPLGKVAIGMAVCFLRTLVKHYDIESISDGMAIRGAYHWEPASDFSVRLTER